MRDHYSSRSAAIAARTKMLTDDAASDREAAIRKVRRGKKKAAQIAQTRNVTRIQQLSQERVAFHLSKNRDAGTIAVRENVPVSVVRGIIDSLTKSKA
jgi:hypothetical protein